MFLIWINIFSLFFLFFTLFHLAEPMCECFGKHSCMSSPLPIAMLNRTFFFVRRNSPCFGQCFAYQNLIILQLLVNGSIPGWQMLWAPLRPCCCCGAVAPSLQRTTQPKELRRHTTSGRNSQRKVTILSNLIICILMFT